MEQAMKKILFLIGLPTMLVSGLFAQKAFILWAGTPFEARVNHISATDTQTYQLKMKALANGDATGKWPAEMIYPSGASVLPYKRIIAFYGNLFSTRMGILGQIPKNEMLEKLAMECTLWEKADTSTPVMPALHYIAATAQASPGRDAMYRFRMPDKEIEKVISWAREINGLAFLDIQTGHSTVKAEVEVLEKFLKMPDVHLGIDPEYGMKNGGVPGTSIGTFDADEINDAIDILVKLVRENQLPPKILIVHRFTYGMVTNYKKIKLVPEVQVVIHMDGFGSKALKLDTYKAIVYREPVQFAGFKLFYKIDRPVLYTPGELIKLKPIPVYIQYQ
jgi:hypothetical protein